MPKNDDSCNCGCSCCGKGRFWWGVLAGLLLAVVIRGLLAWHYYGGTMGGPCPMMKGGPMQMEKAPANK